jgi:transposase
VKGRKRQIVVDSLGLLLRVLVHPANWQDRKGAPQVLARLSPVMLTRLQQIVMDAGYRSQVLARWCEQHLSAAVHFVHHLSQKGFVSLPGRWIVERTFAWLGKCRRLSKDYEQLPNVSETWIYLSMLHLMLRRLSS